VNFISGSNPYDIEVSGYMGIQVILKRFQVKQEEMDLMMARAQSMHFVEQESDVLFESIKIQDNHIT